MFILYLVGGLGDTYPQRTPERCGYDIYTIVLPAPAGGGRTNPTGGKTTHPTNQQVWRGRTDSPGGADRQGGFWGGLVSAPKTGVWANCRRTASTRGETPCNGRTKEGRGEEGPTWPNTTRRNARREHPTQDRDKTQPEEDREDREASTVADRPERSWAANSKQRRIGEQRPHQDSKGEEASIVADSRQGEQEVNQLLAKTRFCEQLVSQEYEREQGAFWATIC